jgi:hypothetical protein
MNKCMACNKHAFRILSKSFSEKKDKEECSHIYMLLYSHRFTRAKLRGTHNSSAVYMYYNYIFYLENMEKGDATSHKHVLFPHLKCDIVFLLRTKYNSEFLVVVLYSKIQEAWLRLY